jgi:hypothetical protein
MAYMNADTGNKVGFRPYGTTSPQCAATLSGLGQNHPFKPEAWKLYPAPPAGAGMGDYEFNRPFDPWELFEPHSGLHGLAGLGDVECVYLADDGVTVQSVDSNSNASECAANGGVWEIPPGTPVAAAPAAAAGVPAGSRLTYTALFLQSPYATAAASPGNVIAAITANLQSQWNIQVVGSSYSGGVTSQGSITLQLQTNVAYGLPSDIKAIVDGAFYNIEGLTAQPSTVTLVGQPASLIQQLSTAQATGDTTTANTILAALNAGGVTGAAATGIETFLMNNAAWIGIGILAMVALPPLIKKL